MADYNVQELETIIVEPMILSPLPGMSLDSAINVDGSDPLPGAFTASPRKIILDEGVLLDSAVTVMGDYYTIIAPTTISLSWYIPAGTEQLTINTNYPDSIDVTGSRPNGKLKPSDLIPLSEQTVEAPAGGGDQSIVFNFTATTNPGNAHIILEVPTGVQLQGQEVTFTPDIKNGQAVNAVPGNKPGASSKPGIGGGSQWVGMG